jgi:hypothetical protein
MLKGVSLLIEALSRWFIRLFPFLVAGCVVIFPAYKGIWAGYVPVLAGITAWWVWHRRISGSSWIAGWSITSSRVWLYLLPALIQCGLIIGFQSVPTYDGLFVYRFADTLVTTGQMDPMTYYPPAQTWWYAGWFSLFGVSFLVAQLSQIPLSLGVTWATRQLARDVGTETSSRWAALLVAWYPSFLAYGLTTPYYHYLYTLMTVLMVWGLIKCWNVELGFWNGGIAMGAGIAAGVGALTKAVQLIAPLQVLTWLVVMACATAIGFRKWVVGMMLFGVGMLVVLGPWMVRNWMVFDDLVPVCTSGGLVMYSANNPESNGLYSGIPDAVELHTPQDMLAHSRWCSDQATTFMREHPGHFLSLALRKFLHTWGSEATFTDLINVRGTAPGWIKPFFSAVFFAGWAAVVAGWVSGTVRLMRRRTPLTAFEVLVGVLVLSNAVVYMVFEGGDRHHLPLVPLIAVLVAVIHVDEKKDDL